MTAATALERILDRVSLDRRKSVGKDRFVVQCPAHKDGNPSLSLTGVQGKTLVHCFAGCDAADVLAALNLTMGDLFDTPNEREYRYDNGRVARRDYGTDGSKVFRQSGTSNSPELYKLGKIRAAVAAGEPIYLVEGEEDVRAAESIGVVGTTSPQGAANWHLVDYSPLSAATVHIVADLDKAGLQRAADLAYYLPTIGANVAGVYVSKTGGDKHDLSDHVAAGFASSELVSATELPAASRKALEKGPIIAPDSLDGSTVQTVFDGSILGASLTVTRAWFARFVSVPDDLDLDLLTLWAAHTHVVFETYSTPRLVLDSTMPGSGKTTVLEHLQRLCLDPIQAASISSPALLARMLSKGIRTILIDEVDRSLDPKKPGVEDLIAILNSGYKRGATRPVLVPAKGGEWDVSEMSTFAPVAMAGNSPHLPDDTRSRSIRVLLMPDLYGTVEASDWEEIEEEAGGIAHSLTGAMGGAREFIRTVRPPLPAGCVGRMKEKWGPLKRVAAAAGGTWPEITDRLIERDLQEAEMEKEEGLMKMPPQMVLLTDLYGEWGDSEPFLNSHELVRRLTAGNADYWSGSSAYGRELSVQRLGRLLAQVKIRASKNPSGQRGYHRESFEKAWRQSGIAPQIKPSITVRTAEPSNTERHTCPACGLNSHTANEPHGYLHPGCEVTA